MTSRAIVLAVLWLSSSAAFADITLKVRPEWVEKYKDRATMESPCKVDFVPDKVHPPSEDGDIHIAVRCDEAGVPAVAEIQNAKKFPDAIKFLKDNKGSQVSLTGAWRIWPEHGGSNALHSQAKSMDTAFTTSNPDHVVEIHSLSLVGTNNVRSGWTDIQGFKAKDAYTAFMAYESKKFRIRQQGNLVAMTFPGVGYNYVKFQLVAGEKAFNLDDGHSMFAAVTALDGELISRRIRMIFADGTPPDAVAKTLNKGDCKIVLGMPRVSLALVSWRLAHKDDDRDPLDWQMPYEIVVTGVLPGTCATPDYDVDDPSDQG